VLVFEGGGGARCLHGGSGGSGGGGRLHGACWGRLRAAAHALVYSTFSFFFFPSTRSLAGGATRISEGLNVFLVGIDDNVTAAVIGDVITTAAGVLIPTGAASATLTVSGTTFSYLIQSECATFGISRTTGRTRLGSLAWLELGDKEADFTSENNGRGKLVTTKPTKKKASTALIKTVAGSPPFKIYIRTYKPPKPATGAGAGAPVVEGDDGVGDAEGESEDSDRSVDTTGPPEDSEEEDDAPAGAGAGSS
jgi:hypothetical protein